MWRVRAVKLAQAHLFSPYFYYSGRNPNRYIATPPVLDPSWKRDDPRYMAALEDEYQRSLVKLAQYTADYAKMYPELPGAKKTRLASAEYQMGS